VNIRWLKARSLGVLFVVMWTTACNDSAGYADSASSANSNAPATGSGSALGLPPPIPATGGFIVRGQVYDFFNGTISGANININITLPTGGYSYTWAYGTLQSNQLGRYETVRLPPSHISILAFRDGYVQPCVFDLDLAGPGRDLEIDIEMVSRTTLDSFAPPPPLLRPGPAFTGSVFEATSTGRQAVAGAHIWVDGLGGLGWGLATTYSDFGGNYFLCNVPDTAVLQVTKPGFAMTEIGPIDATTPRPLDIELKRQ